MSQPLYIVPLSTYTYIHVSTSCHTHQSPPTSSDALTVSGEELPEVYGDHHPFAEIVPVAPQADVHGARAGLAVHAAEVKRVVGEVIRMPALPLVRRKPEGRNGDE